MLSTRPSLLQLLAVIGSVTCHRLLLLLAVIIGSVTCHRLAGKSGSKPLAPQKLRMVTWNINDNTGMNKKIDDDMLDMLLFKGKTAKGEDEFADIYAIGLQELCYKCDKNTLGEIPTDFQHRLERKLQGTIEWKYEVIGIKGTREVDDCIKKFCKWGADKNDAHGTTALIVLAKKGVVKSHKKFNFVDQCSHYKPPHENFEKGSEMVVMRLQVHIWRF